METVISGLMGIGTLTIALGIYRVANGRLSALERKVDGNILGKVNRSDCHLAQESIKKHFDTRIEDLKTFLKNGGGKQ